MSAAEANDVNKRGGRNALRQKSGGDERKTRKEPPPLFSEMKVEFRTMIVRIYSGNWVKSLLQKYFSGGRGDLDSRSLHLFLIPPQNSAP